MPRQSVPEPAAPGRRESVMGFEGGFIKVLPRWDLAAGAVALAIAVLGGVAVLEARSQQVAAQGFLTHGVSTWPIGSSWTSIPIGTASTFDEVEVAFTSPIGSHRALLTYGWLDAEGSDVGLHPPDAGKWYPAPLTILYNLEDPAQVVTLVDADDLAADYGRSEGRPAWSLSAGPS